MPLATLLPALRIMQDVTLSLPEKVELNKQLPLGWQFSAAELLQHPLPTAGQAEGRAQSPVPAATEQPHTSLIEWRTPWYIHEPQDSEPEFSVVYGDEHDTASTAPASEPRGGSK